MVELSQTLGQLPAAEELRCFARPGLPRHASRGRPDGIRDSGRGVQRRWSAVGQTDYGFGISAKPGGIESSHRVDESDRNATGRHVPGGRSVLVEGYRKLQGIGGRVEG